MKTLICGLLVGFSIGFCCCWWYFLYFNLIRTKEEWYRIVNKDEEKDAP